MMLQIDPSIPVLCKEHGNGEAIFLIDYGLRVNSVWIVRLEGGQVKHFYSDQILIYGNPMDEHGWDLKIPEEWHTKHKVFSV